MERLNKNLQKIIVVDKEPEDSESDEEIEPEVRHGEVKIPPHVVKTNLHPDDLEVEQKIHEAYKNQRFVGRSYEEGFNEGTNSNEIYESSNEVNEINEVNPTQETPSTPSNEDVRTRNPQRRIRTTTTTPQPASKSTKRKKVN